MPEDLLLSEEAVVSAVPALLEWGKGLLEKESLGNLFQFIKGPSLTLAYAIGAATIGGVPGLLAGAVALIGYGFKRVKDDAKLKRQQLLEQYRDDIAAITHKPVNQLELADVDKAAAHSPNGQKNVLAIELENLHKTSIMRMVTGSLTTLLLTAASVAVAYVNPALLGHQFFAAAITSGAGKLISDQLRPIVGRQTGQPVNYPLSRMLGGLTQESKVRPIQPEQVLSIVVETDPALREQISQRFGERYGDLTIVRKKMLAAELEPRYHVAALARAINEQRLKPSTLGFIAYGQGPDLATLLTPPAPAASPKEPELANSNHVARLADARALSAERAAAIS